jgi:cell division septum initiation protein DivIVA
VDAPATAPSQEQLARENAQLRERVDQLEGELAEQAARTNALLAASQERTYWLDRWGLDLNALMERPGAAQFRALLRAVRWPLRQVKRLKRRLLG